MCGDYRGDICAIFSWEMQFITLSPQKIPANQLFALV
jgi:hypothetical protein